MGTHRECLNKINDEASWSIPKKSFDVMFISGGQAPGLLRSGKAVSPRLPRAWHIGRDSDGKRS
jgi:hypothetical protein